MGVDKFTNVKKQIEIITRDCSTETFIYRGTNQDFVREDQVNGDTDQVNSGIYREYYNAAYSPIKIEADIVRRARRHFAPTDSNIKVLTDLRHFGANTTLIDFSRSLMVALFFACNGSFNRNGQLIAFRRTDIPVRKVIDYSERTHDLSIIEPAMTDRSRNRLQGQSSIFVHVPDGFITDDHWEIYTIPMQQKVEYLTFLRKFHDIEEETIFSDFTGFLDHLKRNTPAEAKFYLGHHYSISRKHRKAIACYNEAIEINPLYADAYMNRGNDKERLKDNIGALRDYNEADKIRPNDMYLFLNRGNLKLQSRDYKGAVLDFDIAIKLKWNNYDTYNSRGFAKENLGDYVGAISDYDRAIELKPNHAILFFNRGCAREKNGDTDGAISDYERAIKLQPNRETFYFYLGYTKEKNGDTEGAISNYDRAIDLNPFDTIFYHRRGLAKEKNGDTMGAINDYNRAIELKPNDANLYLCRGRALEKIGDTEGAKADFDLALYHK